MVLHSIPIDQLGSLTAYNEREEAVRLSSLWHETTGVLVLVRHFG